MLNITNINLLNDYQRYVAEMERKRGFSEETLLQKCLLLGEEVGELFKEIRKSEGMATDKTFEAGDAAGEIADVFFILCAIANRLNINLTNAFVQKEQENESRIWE